MRHWYRLVGAGSEGARTFERDGVVAALVPASAQRSVVNAVVYERPEPLGGHCPPLGVDDDGSGRVQAAVRELLAAAERQNEGADGDAERRPARTLRAVGPRARNGTGEGGSVSRQ